MPTIGGIACDMVKGAVPPELKERSEVFQIAGRPGYGLHLLGVADSRFAFEAILYDTKANVLAWGVALQALQGTVQTINTDLGQSLDDMFIESVATVVPLAGVVPGTTTDLRGSVRINGVRLPNP